MRGYVEIMEEISIKDILTVVKILVKPSSLGKCNDLKDAFRNNKKQAVELISCISDLQLLKSQCNLKGCIPNDDDDDICWHYVCICLEVLLILKNYLQKNESELLSVPQQKSIKSIFEFIVSMGLLPYLLKGVGLGIDHRCRNAALFKDLINTSLTDVEKYGRLCSVIRGILNLTEEKSFSSLFMANHMEDLFAALCQLTIPRFKEPTPELIVDREYFQTKFTHLTSASYQPLVIYTLMIIHGSKENPRWLRFGVCKLLIERLLEEGGVLSTIKAIQRTVDYENPNVVTRLESVARLIVTPRTEDKQIYYSTISPQILLLIQSDDINLIRFGVLCCRVLFEMNCEAFEKHISSVMVASLFDYSFSYSENQITQCLQSLHKCYAIPNSEMWSVPVEGLLPVSKIIYVIYCRICDSALVIKKPVEELLWVVLSKVNEELLGNIFKCLLLNEFFSVIKELPDELNFTFGDEGGVKITRQTDNDNKIEYSNCILKLLEEKDSSGKISRKLFLTLLNYCSTLGDEICEVKLFVTELLADLAETERVQKNINDDSESIINFIETLISNKLESSEGDTELLSIALVLLITVMNNMCYKKNPQWGKFKNLSVLLPKLSLHSQNIELKMLCDEVYNIICMQGVTKEGVSNKEPIFETSESNITKSNCDIALEEACDSLIPVRGHAIIQLSKLISAGDAEAKAKKQKILCIFQENLKNEDSYLYLNAIEGMASLAAEFPDTVLVTLTEEYSRTETTVRLKVGESLMRVIRRLGDMIPVYKNELLNSFLSGVRDTDNLVRASSLSNIGELCQLLGFRIGPIASEILNCVECVVATDPMPEPRRAAVMLLTLLLRGLHKDALNVLEPVLLSLYRNLKKIYQLDRDDVVKLHAQLAIEELNKATLSFLFPSQDLKKKIFVIDP